MMLYGFEGDVTTFRETYSDFPQILSGSLFRGSKLPVANLEKVHRLGVESLIASDRVVGDDTDDALY